MNCFDKALCCLLSSILLLASPVHAQNKNQHDTKQVWEPDLGNGRYRNPIIHADYFHRYSSLCLSLTRNWHLTHNKTALTNASFTSRIVKS